VLTLQRAGILSCMNFVSFSPRPGHMVSTVALSRKIKLSTPVSYRIVPVALIGARVADRGKDTRNTWDYRYSCLNLLSTTPRRSTFFPDALP
jgi:hypothetical protein